MATPCRSRVGLGLGWPLLASFQNSSGRRTMVTVTKRKSRWSMYITYLCLCRQKLDLMLGFFYTWFDLNNIFIWWLFRKNEYLQHWIWRCKPEHRNAKIRQSQFPYTHCKFFLYSRLWKSSERNRYIGPAQSSDFKIYYCHHSGEGCIMDFFLNSFRWLLMGAKERSRVSSFNKNV